MNRKIHLVKWKNVSTDRRKGDLVRCLSSLSRTLICKWSWRIVIERNSLRQLLSASYVGVLKMEVCSPMMCQGGEREIYKVRF